MSSESKDSSSKPSGSLDLLIDYTFSHFMFDFQVRRLERKLEKMKSLNQQTCGMSSLTPRNPQSGDWPWLRAASHIIGNCGAYLINLINDLFLALISYIGGLFIIPLMFFMRSLLVITFNVAAFWLIIKLLSGI